MHAGEKFSDDNEHGRISVIHSASSLLMNSYRNRIVYEPTKCGVTLAKYQRILKEKSLMKMTYI